MKITDLKPSKNFEDRRGVNPEDQDKLGELIKETTIAITRKTPPKPKMKPDVWPPFNSNAPESTDGQLLRGIGKADRAKMNAYKVR